MLELVNESTWSAGLYPGWSARCEFQMTVVVKASYRFDTGGQIAPISPALPIIETDSYYGDPERTSLQEAGETAPFKQGGEFYLYGTAHPARAGLEATDVSVGLTRQGGERWQKTLRVFGPRRWKRFLLHHSLKSSGPVTPLPLRYEFAFGGRSPDNEDQQWLPNPVGMGFNVHGGRLLSDQPPCIEMGPRLINAPTDKPDTAGFGPVPMFWEPRLSEAGEPVEDVMETGGCPYRPPVSEAFHNVAPRDQRFPAPFQGGEVLTLRGLFNPAPVQGEVRLTLPALSPQVHTLIGGRREQWAAVWDTLVVNTDSGVLNMVFRAAIPWALTDKRQGWVLLRDPDGEILQTQADEQLAPERA